MTRSRLSPREMSRIAMMAVLLCLCAWLSVPAPIPFTLQTFGLFCALGLLGGRRGSLAILLYLLMGAAGLPVFSGFQGGIACLLGPTGGYLLGFLPMGLLYCLLEKQAMRSLWFMAAALVLGLLLCYALGTLWFVKVYSFHHGPIAWISAMGLCVFPFVLPDLGKLALALLLIRSLRPRLPQQI